VNLQVVEAAGLSGLINHEPNGDAGERFTPFTDDKRVAIGRWLHLGAFDEPRFDGGCFGVVNRVWAAVRSP